MTVQNTANNFYEAENRHVLKPVQPWAETVLACGRRLLGALWGYAERTKDADTTSFNGIL